MIDAQRRSASYLFNNLSAAGAWARPTEIADDATRRARWPGHEAVNTVSTRLSRRTQSRSEPLRCLPELRTFRRNGRLCLAPANFVCTGVLGAATVFRGFVEQTTPRRRRSNRCTRACITRLSDFPNLDRVDSTLPQPARPGGRQWPGEDPSSCIDLLPELLR